MSRKSNRPEQFRRIVEMMSSSWVTPDDAFQATGALRLATFVDELANDLGLSVLRQRRYFPGGRSMMAYHLPSQPSHAFAAAAAKLPEFMRGVAHALQQLERRHPRAQGTLPDLPGMSLQELGPNDRAARGEDGKTLKQTVLDLLGEPDFWLTSKHVQEHYDSTRLAAIVEVLRGEGHNVIMEMRPNVTGKGQHGAYHLFTDPAEESAYLAEREVAERVRAAAITQKAAPAPAKPRTPAQASIAGSSAYGRWMPASAPLRAHNATPVPGAPSRGLFGRAPALVAPPATPAVPSASVMSRLSALQQPGAVAIPVARLDALYPKAGSGDIVRLDGREYRRRFRPAAKDASGRVTQWTGLWEVNPPAPR